MFDTLKSRVLAATAGLAIAFTGLGGAVVAGAASPPPSSPALTQTAAGQTGDQIDSGVEDATPDVNETADDAETNDDSVQDVETADDSGAPEAPAAASQVQP